MATFGERMRELAVRLITKFGKDVVFKSPTTKTYNATTGLVSATTPNVTVRIAPPDSRESYSIGESQVGDSFTLICAKDALVVPVVGMRVDIDDEVYNIVSVRRVYSGPDTAVYTIGLAS